MRPDKIVSKAPGKLVVLGEYAVINGSPSMVLAINRYCHAKITSSDDAFSRMIARTTKDQEVKFGKGEISGFQVVDTVSRFFPKGKICSALIDSSQLFDSGMKVGLGSSAAALTAWAGAWAAFSDNEFLAADGVVLRKLIGMHRMIQGGSGSGIDVAASLYGGVITFQLDGLREPHVSSVQLPKGVEFAGVFTGSAANTINYLKCYREWCEEAPSKAENQQTKMADIAQVGISACKANNAEVFLRSISEYSRCLEALGNSMGTEIFTPAHRHLQITANDLGVSYKASGAGGGDMGLAFSSDSDVLEQFKKKASKNHKVLDLKIAEKGLAVEMIT
tara:strand:+ start:8607 stop:9608 length:1002 start_codon:yes stop_codon:yes gene_type:complete